MSLTPAEHVFQQAGKSAALGNAVASIMDRQHATASTVKRLLQRSYSGRVWNPKYVGMVVGQLVEIVT
jgi:hypothetical protein